MSEIVSKINLAPDFEYTASNSDPLVNYIHKMVGDTDIYFIANRKRRVEDIVATFRIGNRKPELWNAETGEVSQAPAYDVVNGRIVLPLQLKQSGSVFVVFRSPVTANRVVEISKGTKKLLSAKPLPVSKAMYADITNNFTLSVWAKPEADGGAIVANAAGFGGGGGGGAGVAAYIVQPTSGETLYGTGHATIGLNAGRGGATVYERGTGAATNVLTVAMPVSGWTHFAVVYTDGAPSLYVNGKFAGKSPKSGKIVHPEIGDPANDTVFQGHLTNAVIYREPLSEAKIQELANGGIPKPDQLLALEPANGTKLRYFENGKYSMKDSTGRIAEVSIAGLPEPQQITGPWTVSFPPNLGAPQQIVMANLMPLNRHADDGVKFFSGTASYVKNILIPAAAITNGKKLFLDLGWVEVIAEAKLNGKSLGSVWKPPYQFDITGAAKPGNNELEIKVTNLWPNRLIGDESFPDDYQYAANNGRGGAISKIPDWYMKGEPRPKSQRIAFATWKHYSTKDEPLLESGLIGPVMLKSAIEK